MPISDHEEADTRMCLHVLHAVSKGAQNVLVSSVDMDVIVILVGIFHRLREAYPSTLVREGIQTLPYKLNL